MRTLMTKKLAGVLVAALTFAGCTNDLAKEGTADVFMRIVAIVDAADGAPRVLSDVGAGTPTFANVVVAARSKNPNNNTLNYIRAIQLERFEVRYYRSDGRSVEGVDVPYRFAGDVRSAIDIGDSSNNLSILLEVVRSAAKLEPPLLNLRNGGGAVVLTLQAEITLYGRTIGSNDIVKASASVPVEFQFTPTNQLP